MTAVSFAKQPWKHPAVWSGHVVRITGDTFAGVAISVATCECGWSVCAKATGAGHVAQDDATEDHWHSVIAEAGSTAA